MKNLIHFLAFGLFITFALFLKPVQAANAPLLKNDSSQADFKALFNRVDNNFERVQTMEFKVERSLERGLRQRKERWRAIFQAPSNFLVDYDGPPKRIVVAHGEDYSEYIPEAKKVLELKFSNISPERKQEIFMQLLPRVAIPGLRLAFNEVLLERMQFRLENLVTIEGRPAYHIVGEDAPKDSKNIGKKESKKPASRMNLWIDSERNALMRVEIYEGGKFISSIENHNFKEFDKDLWIPSEVVVKNSTPQSMEKATYQISRMVINQPLAKDVFTLSYAKDVQVLNGNDASPQSPPPVKK